MLQEVEVDNTVGCDENDDVTCRMVNSEKVINVEDASSIKKLTPRHIQGHNLSYLYLSQTKMVDVVEWLLI